jgi:RNA polymerase subunit RPABC4/transcription elongation factor Spt4
MLEELQRKECLACSVSLNFHDSQICPVCQGAGLVSAEFCNVGV